MSLRKFFLAVVALQSLLLTPVSATPEHAGTISLRAAQTFLSTPSIWGGVCLHAAIRFREISNQRPFDARLARKVSYDQLRPGDLVFFSTSLPGGSHGGFYLGNGEFLHASPVGARVMISQMRTGYYRHRFMEGGRPHGWMAYSQG